MARADLHLGLLQDNGGPTKTVALSAGSVAIDAGIDGICPSTDQRGVGRPVGAHCDSGALESNAPAIRDFLFVAQTPQANGGGSCAEPDYNDIQSAVDDAPAERHHPRLRWNVWT